MRVKYTPIEKVHKLKIEFHAMRNEFLKEVLYKLSLRMVRFNNLTIRVTSMRGLNMNFIKFCFVIQAVDIDTYGEHY